MNKERFKLYMELRENAENLWGHKLIEQKKYEEICTIILERIAREDEFGDTLDREERPKGKWIIDDLDELNRIWKCHCSICDKNPLDYVSGTENWWIYKKQMPKYCPHCGAEIIGTEKEKR